MLCAVLGTGVVWLTLPAIGALIFGDYGAGIGMLAGAAASGLALLKLAGKQLHTT